MLRNAHGDEHQTKSSGNQSYVLPNLPENILDVQREKFGRVIYFFMFVYYQFAREHSRPSSSPTQSSQNKKPLAFLQRVSINN